MSGLEGKVAFITGAGHGQGRSHAQRLAEDGADVVCVDICHDIEGVPYPLATKAELEETVRLVEKAGRRGLAYEADVRCAGELDRAVEAALGELGRIDILLANAGIWSLSQQAWTLDDAQWQTMIDVNLTGQWRTAKAVIPAMIAGGRGGAIAFTSSSIGLKAVPGNVHYTSAKHGVIGLMRTLAHELAPFAIRVNAVCPTTVGTAMIKNELLYRLFRP
ncbi:MAG TPA: mycofactocin-coupled SDR family oxidoreductase, partial [Acidimicrobiales bacterium]|nr:mycofactocin-coupled SDR family oxidoreductase [Acidimicrobiales bacterium]